MLDRCPVSFHSVFHLLHVHVGSGSTEIHSFYSIHQKIVLFVYKSTFSNTKSQMQPMEGFGKERHSNSHTTQDSILFFSCNFKAKHKEGELHIPTFLYCRSNMRKRGKNRDVCSAGRDGSLNDKIVLATKFDPRHSILLFIFLLGNCPIP